MKLLHIGEDGVVRDNGRANADLAAKPFNVKDTVVRTLVSADATRL